MTTKSEGQNSAKQTRKGIIGSSGKERQMISPAERWLLVTEKAYHRAQRRGFVGGDPFDDWADAEQEVDAMYDTDARRVFQQAEAEQLADQMKRAFGGFGLGHLSLDVILEKHREGLERVAEHNRRVLNSTSELAGQQTALFHDAVNEAMETLQSFSQGRINTKGFARQAELSTRALENVLSYIRDLTESAGSVSPSQKKGVDGK